MAINHKQFNQVHRTFLFHLKCTFEPVSCHIKGFLQAHVCCIHFQWYTDLLAINCNLSPLWIIVNSSRHLKIFFSLLYQVIYNSIIILNNSIFFLSNTMKSYKHQNFSTRGNKTYIIHKYQHISFLRVNPY